MNRPVTEQIEDKAVELMIDMKVPRRARLGVDAYAELQKRAVVKERIVSPEEAEDFEALRAIDGTVLRVWTSEGAIETVEDPTLPPDAVVVEE